MDEACSLSGSRSSTPYLVNSNTSCTSEWQLLGKLGLVELGEGWIGSRKGVVGRVDGTPVTRSRLRLSGWVGE